MTKSTTSGGSGDLVVKAIDLLLLAFFLDMSVAIPLLYLPAVLPCVGRVYPPALVDLRKWYMREFGDHLLTKTPDFFVGIMWAKIAFLWPISVASVCAILVAKTRPTWYPITCLLSGVFTATSMAAIMGEMLGSGKASDKLMYMIYVPLMIFSAVATFRGLFAASGEKMTSFYNATAVMKARVARKKKA